MLDMIYGPGSFVKANPNNNNYSTVEVIEASLENQTNNEEIKD